MKEELTPPPSKLNSIEPRPPGMESNAGDDANSKNESSPDRKKMVKMSWKKLGNSEVLKNKKSSFSLGSIKQQEELKS
jgi:hypothetical protein